MMPHLEKLVQQVGVLEGENVQAIKVAAILHKVTSGTEPVQSETGTGHKITDDVTGW